MKLLRSIDRFLYRVEIGLLVVLLGGMVILAFSQVVLRNVFSTGMVWADTVIRHLVLWLGFVGGALATSDERHISIDALTKFIPQRIQYVAAVITNLFATLVCSFLARSALTFLLDEKASGSELMLSLPTWVALIIIPAGYAVIAFHFLVRGVESFTSALTGKTGGTPA